MSRLRRSEAMDVAEWQIGLRRQFGREQAFTIMPLGGGPVFGDFRVVNPESASSYRVSIRGLEPGDNYCACADYATNGLGTCKHVEFALHKLQGKPGARAAFKQGYQPAFSEVWLRYGAPRTIHFRAGQACPSTLVKLAGALFDADESGGMPDARWPELDAFVRKARRLADQAGHELKVYDDVLAVVAEARDAAHRVQALTQAYPKGVKDKGLAKLLRTRLYPYQIEGALFAARTGRVLIGDEMGLGKTVQAIAAAELMARHFGVSRVLVVCPTSLKHQWQSEFKRFVGKEAQVLGGLRAARQQQWRHEVFCKIVNYETLVRDGDLAQAWAPDLLIVDEAQRVKNWNTQAAKAIKRIAAVAVCPHVIVLTGTPLENRLEELVSIVQVVDQHRLGPTWRLLHAHQVTDESGRVTGYKDLGLIGTTLAPLLLRRRKAEVLTQLPERLDKTLFVPLTPEQRVHHDENGVVVSRIVQRWRKTGYLSDVDQRRLQCALQNMRMACNSTWLLDHETDHGGKADELIALLEEIFEDPQAKAVVFSQWLGTHEVLIKRLAARGWGHVFFHGGVPADQRGGLVQRFHDEPGCRLFLSTDAGAAGLNLQHAAAVIVNMDLPWNPALMEQRIGRVHRMGQRQGVQVINLVAEESIEQSILGLLAFKRSLFAGVLDGGEGTVFMEGGRLTQFMKSVDRMTEGLTVPPDEGVLQDVRQEPMPHEMADAMANAVPAAPFGMPDSADVERQPEPAAASAMGSVAAPHAGAPDLWAPLLSAGLQLLDALTTQPGLPGPSGQPGLAMVAMLRTDAATGERYLRVPMPDVGMLRELAGKLHQVLGSAATAPSAPQQQP